MGNDGCAAPEHLPLRGTVFAQDRASSACGNARRRRRGRRCALRLPVPDIAAHVARLLVADRSGAAAERTSRNIPQLLLKRTGIALSGPRLPRRKPSFACPSYFGNRRYRCPPAPCHVGQEAGGDATRHRGLLTGETFFFRDRQVFQTLRGYDPAGIAGGQKRAAPASHLVRGCSTGQEPYSLAMILDEEAAACAAGRSRSSPPICRKPP